MSINKLKQKYQLSKKSLKDRLSQFSEVLKKDEKDIFAELCFCLLTPQSKAKLCWSAIERLVSSKKLYNGNFYDIQKELVGVRFKNNKSRYILSARERFSKKGIKEVINSFGKDIFALREYLVKNVKGLGYKEASHFLRNIGYGRDLAILDRHILKNLKKYSVIKNLPMSLTSNRYLEIEEKMRKFARKIKIPMDELDLLFWSQETGEIFK